MRPLIVAFQPTSASPTPPPRGAGSVSSRSGSRSHILPAHTSQHTGAGGREGMIPSRVPDPLAVGLDLVPLQRCRFPAAVLKSENDCPGSTHVATFVCIW